MTTAPAEIMATIEEALDKASTVVLGYFRKPVPVSIKADDTPVTLADRQAEEVIRAVVAERFPGHGIYGEEQGRTAGDAGTWVIDPIDGTKSFMTGNPLFGILVGFVRAGVVEAGGLAMPALNEKWMAARSGPTRLNGRACSTRKTVHLGEACLLTSSPDFFSRKEYAAFEHLSKQTQYLRFGGDCYTYAMVAGGWADLVVESSLHPYDYLPLVPIIEQAGGVISDWSGRALGLDSGGQVIAAATPELHEAALAFLEAEAE
ncbi:MAG TPA: inositol monophosphatase family protein [Afifellaceae bacterium]|nr:inositol monophosphatase family protein [Afifellaceae bacterium]